MASTAARHTPLDMVQAQPSPALSPTVWLLTRVSPALSMATRIGIGALIVAVSALLAEVLYESFDVTRLSVLFLGGVIVTAVTVGTWPAIIASVLAVVVYNFHLVEPRFTFTFAGDDALTLFVFLAVALMTGSLAGRVRDEALRSRTRADLMTTLFNASRSLSETDTEAALRARLAAQLAHAVGGEAQVVGPDEAPTELADDGQPRAGALLA
ncbi:DUF4118 domain-containing protein, partial [Caulobacter sp. 17J65-9]|uniref:DUF4118 domain-containing protein n=1 Tax=Caulobacter sp. 17J65-9 TaxID=2709382 RepID=UPI0013C8412B